MRNDDTQPWVSVDAFTRMLEEQSALLPIEIFDGLNLGIGVVEHAKRSDDAPGVYILGEYRAHGVMGRGIVLYYGSFARVYGLTNAGQLRREIDRVLKHELTHHLESRAGENDLEIKDAHQRNRLRGEG
ncbi:MAG: hypothetical protein GX810_08415 [Clostridiales bacterium]|nr:hypothetical protein [Clostridiales bacterium]